jgi:hypothetical protein
VLVLVKLIGVDEQGVLLGENVNPAVGAGKTVTTIVAGVLGGPHPFGVTVYVVVLDGVAVTEELVLLLKLPDGAQVKPLALALTAVSVIL